MTDDVLVLDEHRVPDGTRPLRVDRPDRVPSLQPAYLDPVSDEPLTCQVLLHNTHYSLPVPSSCRRRIIAGDHYLVWVGHDLQDRPHGMTAAYCAPCAVREWAHRRVVEVAP